MYGYVSLRVCGSMKTREDIGVPVSKDTGSSEIPSMGVGTSIPFFFFLVRAVGGLNPCPFSPGPVWITLAKYLSLKSFGWWFWDCGLLTLFY